MEQFVLDFLEAVGSIDFSFVWKLFGYALVLFWFVVLYWVWLDSGDRTSNRVTRCLYVLLVAVLNIVGLIIYLIIRPSQTIEEIYWADLERRFLKYETAELGDCPKCGTQLYPGYKYCPNCRYVLKRKCTKCGVYVDKKNKYCPHCGQEVRVRLSPEQLAPTKEVMEQQIQATRDEAVEVVETNKTRYSTQKSLAVRIGQSFVGLYTAVIKKIGDISLKIKSKKEKEEPKVIRSEYRVKKTKKSKGKKKRNKSR